MRIQYSSNCFQVWDKEGYYYEFGCTPDSLQYYKDALGTHNYSWNLSKEIAPYNSTSQIRQMRISYLQDLVTTNGYTSVRDSSLRQIQYGYSTSLSNSAAWSTLAGTVDFHYHMPSQANQDKTFSVAYSTNDNCQYTGLTNTTLRCDDPTDYNDPTSGQSYAPTVMSTMELDSVTSYVGADSSASKKDYSYAFKYYDTPNRYVCSDSITGNHELCAGTHLLQAVTPTVYQNGNPNQLKPLSVFYSGGNSNTYYDGSYKVTQGSTQVPYQMGNTLSFLDKYIDQDTGVGESITYGTAYNNTHGTPLILDSSGNIVDDRFDPLYCWNQRNNSNQSLQCTTTSNYAHPDDQAWSEQVVTQIMALGKDSSASSLQNATTTYHYALADVSKNGCNPINNSKYPQENDCVGDNWIPENRVTGKVDADWADFYHSEYRGFNIVYETSPAGNLGAQHYYSTEGWATQESDGNNYNTGALYEDDRYQGNQAVDSALLQRTTSQYPGSAPLTAYNSCIPSSDSTYPVCESTVMSSRTTWYEGTGSSNSNAPWVQTDNTYDDINPSNLNVGSAIVTTGGVYHNMTKQSTTSSNAPTKTEQWTYANNNQNTGGITYYHTGLVTHHELDDASSHAWNCQDTTYDEGVASGVPTPDAGWATTVTDYSKCGDNTTALKSYTSYDQYGNAVATVDPFGVAHSSVYGSNGCTLATAPAYQPAAWTAGKYTDCTTYDSYGAQPTQQTNALGQFTTTSYDYTQGAIDTASKDSNQQTTSKTYSYDSNGNQIVQLKAPDETGTYTKESAENSTCNADSILPCFEIDTNSSQYANAISHTFYDSQGRAVETRTPLDATHDLVTFTLHDDANNKIFQSLPFRVAHGTGWIDPNGAKDDTGVVPGGTTTYTDALGRTLATIDPNLGQSNEPGITCPALNNLLVTTCMSYGLASAYGDGSSYDYTASIDANGHLTVSFEDTLGRTRSTQMYSSAASISANITTKKETQYDVLDQPTATIVTDPAPQSGQTTLSVTTSATYDDMGRLLGIVDPDRGTHSYTYDEDGRQVTDISGTRTIGTSYDLLGRVGCVQDATPTTDGSGSCSSGSHPLVQNTYDQTQLGTAGTSDFSVGDLTKSVAMTYYPDGTSAATTQQYQHDQRGKVITTTLQISLPSSWNVTNALPTYQMTQAYNDADLPTTTQTTVGGQSSYTFSNAYDSTTGMVAGLSNNATGIANLATVGYDTHGMMNTLNFQTTTGSALANETFSYDTNLRPQGEIASWQSGSGSTGTIFSNNRTYDAVGNVASVTNTQAAIQGVSNSGGSSTEVFCYDEENRLTWAGNTGTVPGAGNGTCGNATPANTLGGAGYTSSYAYDHLGQLWQGPLNGVGAQQQYLYCDSTHPHQLTGLYPVGTTCSNLGGASYTSTYDAWGNVNKRFSNNLTANVSFDNLDHLTQWDAGSSGKAFYVYDASGNRVLAHSTDASNTTSLKTYAFGLEEHTYSNIGVNTGNTYYYSLAGRLLGQLTNGGLQFFLTDPLGSVLSTFSAIAGSALVLGNQTYSPYGTQLYSAGSMGTNKGYTGQQNDPVTGLDYYVARYYDPIVGVFLSADTVQDNFKGFNPYAYVLGNPETKNDPTGHIGWGDVAMGVLAVAVVTVAVAALPVLGAAVLVGVGAIATTAAVSTIGGIVLGTLIGAASAEAGYLGAAALTNSSVNTGDIWGTAAFGGIGGAAAGAFGIIAGGAAAEGVDAAGASAAQKAAAAAWNTTAGIIGGSIGNVYANVASNRENQQAVNASYKKGYNDGYKAGLKAAQKQQSSPKPVVHSYLPSNYSHIYTNTWYNVVQSAWQRSAQTVSSFEWHARANLTYVHLLDAYRERAMYG